MHFASTQKFIERLRDHKVSFVSEKKRLIDSDPRSQHFYGGISRRFLNLISKRGLVRTLKTFSGLSKSVFHVPIGFTSKR